MEFISCLDMVFTWKSSRRAKVCLHEVAQQKVMARNEHFVYVFVDVDVVSRNDVFDVRFHKPTPFCTTRFNVWNTIILMTSRHFWCNFRLESGKMQE